MKTLLLRFALKTFILLLLVGGAHAVQAQDQQGIEFFHGTYEEALAKAKAENKPVFMDAYTTWCGPCRWMSTQVFTKPEVAAYFNENFINLKMDMEKGEGPGLARSLGVTAYPTLFFIDGDGKVLKKVVGAQQPDRLIQIGKEVLLPPGQVFNLKEKYDSGDHSPELLLKYGEALLISGAEEEAWKIAGEFFEKKEESEWTDEQSWKMIRLFSKDYRKDWVKFYVGHEKDFRAKYGDEAVSRFNNSLISSNLQWNITEAAKAGDEAWLEQIIAVADQRAPDGNHAQLQDNIRLFYYEVAGDTAAFVNAAADYSRWLKDQPEQLSALAAQVAAMSNDAKAQKDALAWAESAYNTQKTYMTASVFGSLLFDNGKLKKAEPVLEEAIGLAKMKGMNYDGLKAMWDQCQ